MDIIEKFPVCFVTSVLQRDDVVRQRCRLLLSEMEPALVDEQPLADVDPALSDLHELYMDDNGPCVDRRRSYADTHGPSINSLDEYDVIRQVSHSSIPYCPIVVILISVANSQQARRK